jgi:soluble cytochrome b562
MLDQDRKDQLNKLLDYRDVVSDAMFHIETILQTHFPEEFDTAYQHWIPQISTALANSDRWLNRGEINMQYTISRILDKISEDSGQGVSKFIK